MRGKHVLGLVLVLGLFVASGSALAWGPGAGNGPGCFGGGACWRTGGNGPAWDEDTAKLQDQLYQKHTELQSLMAADQLDEAKIKAVHDDIIKLRDEMSQKRFSSMLDFRKNNPDWRPGYGRGYGKGRGFNGPGYGRGMGPHSGRGQGPCWR